MMLNLLLQLQASPMPVWYKEPVSLAAVISAASTVAYVVITLFILRHAARNTDITKQIAQAAHRPYIGVWNIVADHRLQERTTRIMAEIHNAGNVPAYEFKLDVGLKRNNVLQPLGTYENSHSMIHPGMVTTTTILFHAKDGEIEPLVLEEMGILLLTLTADYEGVANKSYHYEYQAKYNREWGCFVVVRESSTETSKIK